MTEPLDIIGEEKEGNTIAEIYVDECPTDPREWDNLGHMICFHKRYKLGDPHNVSSESFDGWSEVEKCLIDERKAVIILPLYLYDHSGLRMKVGNFHGLLPQGHATFDSGPVGFIYATNEDILKNFGEYKDGKLVPNQRVSHKRRERAKEILENEVKVYDQYLCGDIYGYRIVKKQRCSKCGSNQDKDLDSCWGFYGIDDVRNMAKEALEATEADQ